MHWWLYVIKVSQSVLRLFLTLKTWFVQSWKGLKIVGAVLKSPCMFCCLCLSVTLNNLEVLQNWSWTNHVTCAGVGQSYASKILRFGHFRVNFIQSKWTLKKCKNAWIRWRKQLPETALEAFALFDVPSRKCYLFYQGLVFSRVT